MTDPVRVFFDDQIFTLQRFGGISRYFVELMAGFEDSPDLGIEVVGPPPWSINRHLSSRGRMVHGPRLFAAAASRALNRLTPQRDTFDLIHHTFYGSSYVGRYRKASVRVVTIYDMVPELFPELVPGRSALFAKKRYVEECDLVLCISESTARDLVRLFGQPRAPVVVTPLAAGAIFRPSKLPLESFPERYVLFVGSRGGYKDFNVLAKAFARADLPSDIQLVAAGGGSFTKGERQQFDRLGLEGRVHQVSLDDAHLASAYSNAGCFVFPSRYEGFGLPTLEAMGCGSPTILPATSSHIEVGGDAALRFNAGDAAGLAQVLTTVVNDEAVREEAVKRGFEQAAKFSWARTAAATAEAYRSVFGGLS